MTSDTRAIDLTRRQLLNELDQQVPQYKEARKAFEGPTKDKQAFKLGMEDLPGSRRNTAADASDQMGRLNDSQDRKSTTSELQSLMRISYAAFCLTKKKTYNTSIILSTHTH